MSNTSTVTSYLFDKETGWRIDLPLYIAPGTRVLCLYRVSSAKQLYHDANNEADIPMQRLRCRAFAEQNGWTVVCELQEEGISGHKVRAENRDKVQTIKEYALKQKFDILLVFMFDRIGGIADETPFVGEWLISHGIRVWASEEGEQRIESHTDRLMNYIRFWQADGESQKTAIRTANSLHILNEQGYFTGRVCPYGYELVKSGRMNKRKQEVHDLAVCEDEAAVVREMFRFAYVYGYGAQAIANRLNELGHKNRAGENWHPSTIRAILKNVTYTGVLRCGESQSPVLEKLRIVDDKTFSEVQGILQIRSRKYQDTRSAPLNTRGSSLLAGNIFCGHCGARLSISTNGKGRPKADGTDTIRVRYCCQTRTRKHGNCNGQSGYTVRRVDETVDAFVRSILSRARAVDRSEVIRARNQADMQARKRHVETLRHEVKQAESELQRLQSEIIRALSGESAFTPEMLRAAIDAQEKKYAELSKTHREAEAEMLDSESGYLALSEKFDDLLEWADMYDNADIAAKKMIVSRIVDRVDVHRDYEIEITLKISIEQFINTIEMVA